MKEILDTICDKEQGPLSRLAVKIFQLFVLLPSGRAVAEFSGLCSDLSDRSF